MSVLHGASKTPRKLALYFDDTPPKPVGSDLPTWVQDGWGSSERAVRSEAQLAGPDSPLVFVYLPNRDADALREALSSLAAADETLTAKGEPKTDAGFAARASMASRRDKTRADVDPLVQGVLDNARVYQGGGNEVVGSTLADCVQQGLAASAERLFPDFREADDARWPTVVKRANEGASDPLSALGYNGEADKHPACQLVLDFVGGAGKKGAVVRQQFEGSPYGWPRDAIDGALLALVAAGSLRASRNQRDATAKDTPHQQIGVTDFAREGVALTTAQRIALRGLCAKLNLQVNAGEEVRAVPLVLSRLRAAAEAAGGDAPLPSVPDVRHLDDLAALTGNEQAAAVWERRDSLLSDLATWTVRSTLMQVRNRDWELLTRLQHHAESLPVAAEIAGQISAITSQRSLLADPDPVQPLHDQLAQALRDALQAARGREDAVRETQLGYLESSAEWGQVAEYDRNAILSQHTLAKPPPLAIGADDQLLRTLDAAPLDRWEDRVMSLPTKVQAVREQMARMLMPKAVRVLPPPATLTTEPEVDAYLRALRDEIMPHISENKPVII